MVGWHHRHNGHQFEQTPGDGEGQGGLACRSLWDHKELDMTWQQNNNYSSKPSSSTGLGINVCFSNHN